MKSSNRVFRYFALKYAMNLTLMLLLFMGIIYLFDTVELSRRAAKKADISLVLILEMGLLKLPEVLEALIPFGVLASGIFTFWQFSKRQELTALRSAGFSIWQFLMPVVSVAVFTGVLYVTVLNPLGAVLMQRFEALESLHLKNESRQIALSESGIWLHQYDLETEGYFVFHAQKIKHPEWIFEDITILFFDKSDIFTKRLNASSAILNQNEWYLNNVYLWRADQSSEVTQTMELPTSLTIKDIEDSFSSEKTLSFWSLPSNIKTLKETGFDANRLEVYYHKLLSQPFLFMAMILLAASVGTKIPRFQGAFKLIVLGIFIGFFVFFASNFLQALGASGQIPAVLAAWSPALISFLCGLTAIITIEDG